MNIWGPWIEWHGGECPIPDAKAGEYELRSASLHVAAAIDYAAEEWDWTRWLGKGDASDIVAYRTKARLEDLIGKRLVIEYYEAGAVDRNAGYLRKITSNGNIYTSHSPTSTMWRRIRPHAGWIKSISAVADEPAKQPAPTISPSLAPQIEAVSTPYGVMKSDAPRINRYKKVDKPRQPEVPLIKAAIQLPITKVDHRCGLWNDYSL